MDGNVVDLRKAQVKPEPLSISTYSLQIGGELYQVRRAVDAGTERGFVMIKDRNGQPVLVFSASFPDSHVGQLIVAWRAGLQHGRRQGSLEA